MNCRQGPWWLGDVKARFGTAAGLQQGGQGMGVGQHHALRAGHQLPPVAQQVPVMSLAAQARHPTLPGKLHTGLSQPGLHQGGRLDPAGLRMPPICRGAVWFKTTLQHAAGMPVLAWAQQRLRLCQQQPKTAAR